MNHSTERLGDFPKVTEALGLDLAETERRGKGRSQLTGTDQGGAETGLGRWTCGLGARTWDLHLACSDS